MLAVPGVRKVTLIGEQKQRIFVDISYRRLATLGIGPAAVLDALTAQNALAPAGVVETGAQSIQLRMSGAFDDLDAVRATPIAAAGRAFKLGDVAAVGRGYEDPPTYLVRHAGAPALMLGARRRCGARGRFC